MKATKKSGIRHGYQVASGSFGPYRVEVCKRRPFGGDPDHDFHACIQISDLQGHFNSADRSGRVAIYKLAALITASYQGTAPVCVNAGDGSIYIETDTTEDARKLIPLLLEAGNDLGVEWEECDLLKTLSPEDQADAKAHRKAKTASARALVKTSTTFDRSGNPIRVSIPKGDR